MCSAACLPTTALTTRRCSGVQGYVVPAIAAPVVGLVAAVAVLLLLGDEGPLLIELHRAGPRGKRPRTRRGVAGRGRRPAGRSGRRCPCSRRRGGRSCGRRSPPG